ncbi:type I-C CRISPR-associated protein Cas8c/Csd1 [Fusicatenibacter sp.]
MILQALVKYYEDLEKQGKISKRGWCTGKVSYGLQLSYDGKVQAVLSLKREQQTGKKTILSPQPLTVPEMVTRSSGVSANFLCDNSKYILGIDEDGTNKRMLECFQSAKEKHLQILQNVQGEAAHAICAFFENWEPEQAKENPAVAESWEELTEGSNLIFLVNGKYAQDDEMIQKAWEKTLDQRQGDAVGICLVTGKPDGISRIHKNIKGIPGAQSSGASLVSFNAPAFESYNKEQSYNAPVGKYAEFAYTTALNYLLSQKKYTFSLGDSMVVYWAEEAKTEYQDFFSTFLNPTKDNEDVVHDVLEKIEKGQYIDVKDIKINTDQRFYILCLAPNAARLSVRFFYQNSFGNVLRNFKNHYQRLEVPKPKWAEMEYLGVDDMLKETVNQKSKDKKPVANMAAMVLEAVLADSRYPASLYTDTLIRIRAEQGRVTWGRAAIIKAYLIKNCKWEDGETYMETEKNEIAFTLGQLFSVLESIQMDANPGIKSTIRDRYFNAACATPAIIFPILIKLKNSHIRKLERDSSKIYYEKLLTKLIGELPYVPKQLSLEEQGKFILGYYHQTQKKYEKREEK